MRTDAPFAEGPRLILLDVGYTLLRPQPAAEEVCTVVGERLGVPVSLSRLRDTRREAEFYYYAARSAEPHIWAAEQSVRRFWMAYYTRWLCLAGLDGQAERVAAAVYDEFGLAKRWAPYPDVAPALSELRSMGVRLGAVSDWGAQLVTILHDLGLSRHLDLAVVSANVGAAKPDAHLYRLALQRAGTSSEATWHVGDDYRNDILGARSAGIAPVLLDRQGEAPRVDCPVVRNLSELPELVRASRGRRNRP